MFLSDIPGFLEVNCAFSYLAWEKSSFFAQCAECFYQNAMSVKQRAKYLYQSAKRLQQSPKSEAPLPKRKRNATSSEEK